MSDNTLTDTHKGVKRYSVEVVERYFRDHSMPTHRRTKGRLNRPGNPGDPLV